MCRGPTRHCPVRGGVLEAAVGVVGEVGEKLGRVVGRRCLAVQGLRRRRSEAVAQPAAIGDAVASVQAQQAEAGVLARCPGHGLLQAIELDLGLPLERRAVDLLTRAHQSVEAAGLLFRRIGDGDGLAGPMRRSQQGDDVRIAEVGRPDDDMIGEGRRNRVLDLDDLVVLFQQIEGGARRVGRRQDGLPRAADSVEPLLDPIAGRPRLGAQLGAGVAPLQERSEVPARGRFREPVRACGARNQRRAEQSDQDYHRASHAAVPLTGHCLEPAPEAGLFRRRVVGFAVPGAATTGRAPYRYA